MLITESKLRRIIREELRAIFQREVVMEHPDGTTRTERHDILELLVYRLQHNEGRMVGLQQDVESARNRVGEMVEQVHLLGKALLAFEQPLQRVAALSDAVRPALEAMDANIKGLPGGQSDT